jgi:hypothetical protein
MKVSFRVMGPNSEVIAAEAAATAREFFGHEPHRIVSVDVVPMVERPTGLVLVWAADVVAESSDAH